MVGFSKGICQSQLKNEVHSHLKISYLKMHFRYNYDPFYCMTNPSRIMLNKKVLCFVFAKLANVFSATSSSSFLV